MYSIISVLQPGELQCIAFDLINSSLHLGGWRVARDMARALTPRGWRTGKASVVPLLAAEAYSAPVRKLPPWLRPPHLHAPMVPRLALRATGASAAARSERALLPPAAYASKVQHQQTVRGHSAAVYCVTFDRTGRRLITGSDDTFIKVRFR